VVVFNEGLVGVVEQYVEKGSKLYIEGQLQTRKWTDQGGNEKYSTEVVLAAFGGQLVMLGSPTGDGEKQQTKAATAAELVDDEIPF
jgi:single-strand DNA-binding protein